MAKGDMNLPPPNGVHARIQTRSGTAGHDGAVYGVGEYVPLHFQDAYVDVVYG